MSITTKAANLTPAIASTPPSTASGRITTVRHRKESDVSSYKFLVAFYVTSHHRDLQQHGRSGDFCSKVGLKMLTWQTIIGCLGVDGAIHIAVMSIVIVSKVAEFFLV